MKNLNRYIIVFLLKAALYFCSKNEFELNTQIEGNGYTSKRSLQSTSTCVQDNNKKFQYYDEIFKSCQFCDNQCNRGCELNPFNCLGTEKSNTGCKNRFMKYQGKYICLEKCYDSNQEPAAGYTCKEESGNSCKNWKDKNNYKICNECNNTNYFLYPERNVCLEKCETENGWFSKDKVNVKYCERCHHTCQKCDGVEYNKCTKCVKGLILQGSECKKDCDDGFQKDAQQMMCFECKKSLNCICSSKNQCNTCKDGFFKQKK